MFTGDSGHRRGWIFGSAIALLLLQAATSWAIFLDDDQNVAFRGRLYTQWSIRAEGSPNTPNVASQDNPTFKAGQLVQQRNFYNPELDANLTKYAKFLDNVNGLTWLSPDDFKFRIAGWGFYDGIYDYGSSQYAAARSAPRVVPQGTPRPFVTTFGPSFLPLPQQVVTTEQQPCDNPNGCVVGTVFSRSQGFPNIDQTRLSVGAGVPIESIFIPLNGRQVYANQNRVNELYLSYSKGPLFVRLGRQSISWGESDTIALLDANNPFDITLGVPGFFEDIDEARIPLWTLRTSYELYSSAGPFASGFLEGYWVPGNIDNTIAYAPSPTGISAYGPTGVDPHIQLIGGVLNNPIMPLPPLSANRAGDSTSVVLVDKQPQQAIKRSRGGVRFQTVIDREHTASAWWYRTFNNAPIARLVSPPSTADIILAVTQRRQTFALSSTERADVDVFGLADTFFLSPIDSIVRLEAEYFLNEMSFLEWRPDAPEAIKQSANIPLDGTTNYNRPVPRTNHLRWEVGLDRFMFIRALNPTNSFLLTGAVVGDYNLDSTVNKRYAYGPSRPTKGFEAIAQVHAQTDYMHGKLTPSLTTVINYAGVLAVNAKLDYRITDYLIAGLQYVVITGDFHQIGFFRSYDQVGLRMTYQLN